MKKALTFSVKISLSAMVIMSAVFYFEADFLVALFMKNEEIIEYGSRFLQGLCLGLAFLCMDFLAVGVFQACGMGRKAFIFALLRKIVMEIPALFILNHFFPLYGLAYAQFVTEVILAIAAIIVLKNLFDGLMKKSEQ